MKAIKILLKAVICLVVLVIVALLTMPVWFGPVAKGVANAVAPKVVKTDFNIARLSLNPYTARFELGDLRLDNPEGYSEKLAVTVGEIVADAETASLLTDVIHVEEIKVKDVFVSIVSGGENGVLNFKQFQYNVAGGKDKYEAKQAEAKAKAETQPEKKAEEKPESKGSEKKFIIDRLEISGLVVQLSVIPIRIPSITLTDIGKKSNGATLEEAWQQIVESVTKAAGVVGDQLKALGSLTSDATKQVTQQADKVLSAAATVGGNVGKSAESAAKSVGSAASKAAESTTKVVGDGAKKMGEGAKAVGESTTKVVGEGAKAVGEGAKAVGEGAKKALESIKSLW